MLKAVIHADRLECFCTEHNSPTAADNRKCLPFESEGWQLTPACGAEPISVNIADCGPIDEITLVNSVQFEEFRSAAVESYVEKAKQTLPKKRDRGVLEPASLASP
eukprot:COSAG02_NODE_2884_length_7815_cov_95.201503_8_plen_106_part_00